ncbi:MAG: hypothetical protein MJZ12_05030 [Prevotella sp.]|nr:hypothetical protein [Prevotella sp.]
MKKRLLLALAFLATALTGFALEVDSYAQTPQGRFKITGEDILNVNFIDGYNGWTALGELAPADLFNYSAEKGGIVALNSELANGMYYKLTGIDAGTSYVVTFTIASEEVVPNQNIMHSTDLTTGTNIITIVGSTDGNINPTFDAENVQTNEITNYSTQTEILPGEAKTYSFAFSGDGTPRTYFVKLAGVDANLTIKGITVQEAVQYADFERYMMTAAPVSYAYVNDLLDLAKKIKGAYAWEESEDLVGLNENIEAVEALMADPESTVDDFSGAMEGLTEAINVFTKSQMDDFLPSSIDKVPLAAAKVSKQGAIGIWNDGANRVHSNANDFYDLGHYQNGSAWGYSVGGSLGLKTQIELAPGIYVFSAAMRAATREPVKGSWWENQGLQFAQGELYVNKVLEDGTVSEEKFATSELYPVSSSTFTRNTIVFTVEEKGKYQIAMNTWANEAYQSLTTGSVVLPYGFYLYAKTTEKYSKAQLDYEEAVRAQIKAGRDKITEAEAGIADAAKSWNKAELQAVLDELKPEIVKYEAMSQDDIIATFDEEVYDKTQGLEATITEGGDDYYRLLESEVYVKATKGLIAAVKTFNDQNAIIDNLTAAIANTEAVRDARIYTYATGKDALNDAIKMAQEMDAHLRAEGYSEENVEKVNNTIAALNEAIASYKTTIPADKITTIADIDFANAPVLNEESQLYEVKGNKGIMVLPSYVAPDGEIVGTPYSNGRYVNGELILGDVLRVGADAATVALEGIADDAVIVATFDYYYGSLITKKAGYKFLGEENAVICGLNCSKYSGNDDLNTFAVDYNGKINSIGSSSASNDAICVEANKTTFTVTIDLGAKTMQCSTRNSAKGSFDSAVITEGVAKPTTFQIQSDYNNTDRRCWFDNLLIQAVDAGPCDGIKNVNAANAVVAPVKALVNGQVVIKTAKGTFTAAGAQVK